MLTYKEFYIWLDGYLSSKSKEENDGNVYFMDIFPILEKMKNVDDDDSLDLSKIHITRKDYSPFKPVVLPLRNNEDDDLGKPPKIVM